MSIRDKKYLFILSTVVTLSIVYFFRDLTPDNELKYISIIEESMRNNNFITFYNHGVIYADKPPLYFWLLMLTKKISGTNNQIIDGLFSIVPAIMICLAMVRITREELTEGEGLLGMGMLMTTGLFIGSALVLRMDMLMCMFIVLSLESFYRVYIGRNSRRDIYLMYIYLFLGLFTKGPVGILFPLITIILFLVRERKVGKAKDLKPLLGVGILAVLCILWFTGVYLDGGREYLYDLTVKQTAGRAYKSFHHVRPFYYYLQGMWSTFLPWSLLYIFTFILSFVRKMEETSLERFMSSAIIGNFIFMSMVSSKLGIYLLPIYPFVTFYTLIILKKMKGDRLWQGTILPFALIVSLVLPGTYLASKFADGILEIPVGIYLGLGIVSLSGVVSLINLKKKSFERTSWSIILGFMLLILLTSFELPEINEELGVRVLAERALEASEKVGSDKYISFNFQKAENMDVYLKKEVPNIRDVEELRELVGKEDVILFVRGKDIERNRELSEILSEENLVWNSKNYYLYTGK